ncbi:protein of unknown function (plasmid) [Azospirillum baldaniorum]|uniref:TonB-dependent receptor-like beta-barrel domain-containing protein n=1 Tax=Azospirillum baldaniorum TaxID=1064539 RepID=A0A9P1JXR1_9PROT|nr:protein of unknown function [Azospirillum baldaniorum]
MGVKQSFLEGRGEWTLAAYHIVKDKLLTTDPNRPGITVQVGQQSSRGLEASLSLGLWEGVRGDVNGALLRTKYDDFIQTVSGRAGTHRQCLGKLGLPAGLGGAGRRAVYRQDLRRRRQHRHAARLYSGQRRPGLPAHRQHQAQPARLQPVRRGLRGGQWNDELEVGPAALGRTGLLHDLLTVRSIRGAFCQPARFGAAHRAGGPFQKRLSARVNEGKHKWHGKPSSAKDGAAPRPLECPGRVRP